MFKGLLKVIFIAALIETCASTAFAYSIWPVDSVSSSEPQSTFAYDEKPWIYVDVPGFSGSPGLYPRLSVNTTWTHDNNGVQETATSSFKEEFYPNGFQDKAISLDLWDSLKESGTWNVSSTFVVYTLSGWSTNIISTGSASTTFEVQAVPEPASLLLLGCGLAGLMAFKKRIS